VILWYDSYVHWRLNGHTSGMRNIFPRILFQSLLSAFNRIQATSHHPFPPKNTSTLPLPYLSNSLPNLIPSFISKFSLNMETQSWRQYGVDSPDARGASLVKRVVLLSSWGVVILTFLYVYNHSIGWARLVSGSEPLKLRRASER